MEKMKMVLAKKAMLVREERERSKKEKQDRIKQTHAELRQKRLNTQARREAHMGRTNAHALGSKLSRYSAAVTKANLSKDVHRMRRVNRHPNPNPRAPGAEHVSAPSNNTNDGDFMDDELLEEERPRNSLGALKKKKNIWADIYAMETEEFNKIEQDRYAKTIVDRCDQAKFLSAQLKEQEASREAERKQERDYAAYKTQELNQWKEEERAKAKAQVAKNEVEKERFMAQLRDIQERKARIKQKKVREEQREVRVAKRALEEQETRKRVAKETMKVKMATIQKENIDALDVKRAEREKIVAYEIEMTRAYQAKLDKQEEDREAALKAMTSHQALLYAKGKTTQDQIAEFNAREEAKMIAAQQERNRQEDEKARRKAAAQKKADIDQVLALRDQQTHQATKRQADRQADMDLAMKAKIQDHEAAMAAMHKHYEKRAANMQHRQLIEKQKYDDKVRMERAAVAMNDLEMQINKSLIDKVKKRNQNQTQRGNTGGGSGGSLTMSGRAIVSSR